MKKNNPQSGIFNPRTVGAFSLCAFGVVLAMLSLHGAPLANTNQASIILPNDPFPRQSDPTTFGLKPNTLPAGVPLPPGRYAPGVDPLGNPTSANPSGSAPITNSPGSPLSTSAPNGLADQMFNRSLGQPQSNPLNGLGVGPTGNVAPEATATNGWSIVTSPPVIKTDTPNTLNAVTCVSASECWAIGYYYYHNSDPNTQDRLQTLVERWDGNSWAVVPSPNTDVTQHNLLLSVACASASECWAVGYSQSATSYQTLIERWDGTSWTLVPSPNNATQVNVLYGVTCASASECWAVGYYVNTSSTQQTLIERWDGAAWNIVSSPNTSPAQSNLLQSVTCASTSDCWAVGYYFNTSSTQQTLIERWDGTSWNIVSSPNTSPAQSNLLYGVTCASASECWAIGNSSTLLNPVKNVWLESTLVERWNGNSWAIVNSPNVSFTPGSAQPNFLLGVTCASTVDCWSIGEYRTTAENDLGKMSQTLVQRWNGTSWNIVNSPNAGVPYDVSEVLSDVTCVSGLDCWAVGYEISPFAGGPIFPLIERWNGTSWAVVNSPRAATQKNLLLGVTCASASDCWAVGYSYYAGNDISNTLIERWDGTSWTVVQSPNGIIPNNRFRSVACASTSECWAVGMAFATPDLNLFKGQQTLIERWDGNSWQLVTSPNPVPNPATAADCMLMDVACTSDTNCWAVGFANSQTLIERWDGSSWRIVASANTSSTQQNNALSVACASASDCWAVGYAPDPTGTHWAGLIQHWDGSTWTIVPSPRTSTTENNFLWGVACASASECWAVGRVTNTVTDTEQTLIERWDGTSWSIAASANTSISEGNALYGVACASASDCFAVGHLGGDSQFPNSLIERYRLPSVQLNTVVSRMTHGSITNPPYFDVPLPLTGTRGVECRSSSSLGAGNYTLVFSFANPLTSVGSVSASATGPIQPGPSTGSIDSNDPHNYIVNLTGLPNAQYITTTLTNVTDSLGEFSSAVSATMGVLIGDVNANGVVTNADVSLVKAQVAAGGNVDPAGSNFRDDVNANGVISNADVSLTKAQVAAGAQLPSPP